jgi:hypothetical protein
VHYVSQRVETDAALAWKQRLQLPSLIYGEEDRCFAGCLSKQSDQLRTVASPCHYQTPRCIHSRAMGCYHGAAGTRVGRTACTFPYQGAHSAS